MENIDKIIEKNLIKFELDEKQNEIVKQNLKEKVEKYYEENNINFNNDKELLSASINICLKNEINILWKIEELRNFKSSYRKKIYLTILFGIIIPILFTVFVVDVEYKLIILVYIICSILISSFYIIVLEYIDYSKKKELNLKKEERSSYE